MEKINNFEKIANIKLMACDPGILECLITLLKISTRDGAYWKLVHPKCKNYYKNRGK